MRLSRAAVTLVFLAAACGGGGGGGGTDAPVVATLALSPGAIDTLFSRGLTVQLIVQAKDGGGNVINNPALSFSSGNQGVATVTQAGLITAQGTGKTNITVASGSASQSVEVVVRRKVASITVTPATRTLAPNQTQTLTVRALDALGTEVAGAATPTFESNNTAAATVDGGGTVTAVAVGSATITVRVTTVDGTRTATSVITVGTQTFPSAETVTLGGSSFSPQTVDIAVNGTVTWTNSSGIEHNVTFLAPSITDIPNHLSGSNSRTFNTVGSFGYDCTIHAGMSGTVIVH
jgi:plastocyanin